MRSRGAACSAVLAGRFALRARAVQQFDQRVDRFCLRKIYAALVGRLDQAANDLGAADRFSVFETDVDGQTIEICDMAVQKNDGDFGPGLGVDNRTTSVALCRAHTHSYRLYLNDGQK